MASTISADSPPAQLLVRSWSYQQFRFGHASEEPVGDEIQQVGGVVDDHHDFGTLVLHPRGMDSTARGEVFSNETGFTYWVGSQAPSGVLANGTPIGDSTRLVQHQFFKKASADATLRIVVSKTFLEAIDGNGGPPTTIECPWQSDKRRWVACRRTMWSWVNFNVSAATMSGATLMTTGGFAELTGWRGAWSYNADTEAGSTAHLWSRDSFTLDNDVDGLGTESNAQLSLSAPITIDIPLSSLSVGDIFILSVDAKASTLNHRQRESYLSAFFRDPEKSNGLSLQFNGLEAVETPLDPPPPIAPVPAPPCPADAPARGAGRIHFDTTAFTTPETPGEGATIVVTRSGGSRGAVSAMLTTSDGSAIGGTHYVPVTTPVLFADGESGSRVVHVPILANDVVEANRTVNLTLSEPMGCARLGQRTQAVLTIMDDSRAAPPPPPPAFTVGGTISGLAGAGLVLRQTIDGNEVSPTTDGAFTFDTPLTTGSQYNVIVASQPINPIQQCTVANAAGTIAAANVTDVAVQCVTPLPNGALDPGFGNGGKATTGLPGGAAAMALQDDGKIVLVGGLTLARYNVDGAPDATFGTNGSVAIAFNGGALDAAHGLAIQPDGKIVVVGFTRNGSQDDFAVARYNADGTVDTTFGTGGKISTDFGGSTDEAWAILVEPDGRLVVAGHAAMPGPLGFDNDFAVARYTRDGALDASFGTGGRVTTNIAGRTDLGHAAALQVDGKVIVAGRVANSGGDDPDVGLVRYNSDGTPDASFGTNGVVRADLTRSWDEATGIVVQPDGNVVVSAEAFVGASFVFALARFTADGHLDGTFGSGGLATTAVSTMNDFAHGLALQPDGKIVVAGQSSNLANQEVAVARHNPDGSLDTSFGVSGRVIADFFGSVDSGNCVAIQPDGKIVVAGSAKNGASVGLALMRLLP